MNHGGSYMEILDDILDILKDGRWHSINEISTDKRFKNYSLTQVGMILNLLEEKGNFIELEQREIKARLTKSMLEFLRKIRWLEKIERSRS